jgi:hypothetical protein
MNNKIIPLNWDNEVWKFDDFLKNYVRNIKVHVQLKISITHSGEIIILVKPTIVGVCYKISL